MATRIVIEDFLSQSTSGPRDVLPAEVPSGTQDEMWPIGLAWAALMNRRTPLRQGTTPTK